MKANKSAFVNLENHGLVDSSMAETDFSLFGSRALHSLAQVRVWHFQVFLLLKLRLGCFQSRGNEIKLLHTTIVRLNSIEILANRQLT